MAGRIFVGVIEDIIDEDLTFVIAYRRADRRRAKIAINDDQALKLKPHIGDEVKVWTTGLADSTERLVRFEL